VPQTRLQGLPGISERDIRKSVCSPVRVGYASSISGRISSPQPLEIGRNSDSQNRENQDLHTWTVVVIFTPYLREASNKLIHGNVGA
ncbi:hypothetical protein APX70_00024, partial [Pseudomonas syringae pv. maculicola]